MLTKWNNNEKRRDILLESSQKTRKVHSRITNPRLFIQFHQRRCERAPLMFAKTVPDRSMRALGSRSPQQENRVAPLGCSVAFSRRMLKALRLPWRPTTTAARCNYLKNARRSPILLPTTPGGLPRTERCKSSRVDFCIRVPVEVWSMSHCLPDSPRIGHINC